MKALKKRPIAILICVAVIALSTIYSAHRSLGAKVRELTDSFYTGVYDESQGVTKRSVSSQLARRCDAANGLLSLGNKHISELDNPDIVASLSDTRNQLIHSSDVGQKFKFNAALDAGFNELCADLESLALSERDKTGLEEYKTSFRGAQAMIAASGYNEAVRAFERNTLEAFPANILKGIAFVPAPEFFE